MSYMTSHLPRQRYPLLLSCPVFYSFTLLPWFCSPSPSMCRRSMSPLRLSRTMTSSCSSASRGGSTPTSAPSARRFVRHLFARNAAGCRCCCCRCCRYSSLLVLWSRMCVHAVLLLPHTAAAALMLLSDQRGHHRRRAHHPHHQPRPRAASGGLPSEQRRHLHGHDQPRLRHGPVPGAKENFVLIFATGAPTTISLLHTSVPQRAGRPKPSKHTHFFYARRMVRGTYRVLLSATRTLLIVKMFHAHTHVLQMEEVLAAVLKVLATSLFGVISCNFCKSSIYGTSGCIFRVIEHCCT